MACADGLIAFLLVLVSSFGFASEPKKPAETNIKRAFRVALAASERCHVDLGRADVRISRQGRHYKVQMFYMNQRGGGASIRVGDDGESVESISCLQ